ncbi:MAG TPA: DUF5947 family protein [Gemmatimonadaceae bacterium]
MNEQAGPLGAERLRRFLTPAPARRSGEYCEFCAEELPEQHAHVVNVEARALVCACRPCYLLFTNRGAAGGRFRAVPQRYRIARDVLVSNGQWDELQIPVGIAFFFYNSAQANTVAFYPSPAGATESLLPLGAWQEIVHANPALGMIEPDVEALLARRLANATIECYVVPIDACYELVGRMRRSWKGFDGGAEGWADIEAFFGSVRERAEPYGRRES